MFRHSGVGRRFSGQCSCSDNGFVEVIVTEQKPTFFMKIVNWESAAVQARAVAGAVPFTQYPCIIALNPTAEGALTVPGTANLQWPRHATVRCRGSSTAAHPLTVGRAGSNTGG